MATSDTLEAAVVAAHFECHDQMLSPSFSNCYSWQGPLALMATAAAPALAIGLSGAPCHVFVQVQTGVFGARLVQQDTEVPKLPKLVHRAPPTSNSSQDLHLALDHNARHQQGCC